jgi:hypothetical protein
MPEADFNGSPQSVGAFITYQEIFSQRLTPRHVELLFERMNQAAAMSTISSLALLLNNDPINAHSSQQQRNLTRPYESEHPWIARVGELVSSGRVLIHEIQMGIMARLALLHSSDADTQGDFGDLFFRALLAVNDLHGRTHFTPGTPIPKTPEAFLQVELQSALLPNERLAYVLHRYNRFFQWCRQIDQNDPDYLSIDADFSRLIGMTFEDYAAACFCVFSNFLTLKSATDIEKRGGAFTSLKALFASLPDPTALEIWFDRFSLSLEAMTTELLKRPTTFRSADLLAFVQRPLVVVEEDIIICPVPALLQNTAGTGLYFALYDAFKQVGEDAFAERLSRLFGRFLEDYCDELLTIGTDGASLTKSREIQYKTPFGDRKSTDIVICDGDGVASFVEISKKRFNLMRTIMNEDATGLSTDLDQMIVEKAEQIDRSFRDLRNLLYSYPFEVKEIVPIIVTGQDVPGMLAIRSLVRKRVQELALFEGLPADELTYLSIEELESLVVMLPGSLNLGQLLREKAKHKSPVARAESVGNYIYYFRPDVSRTDRAVRTTLPGYSDYFRDVIMKTIEKWGIEVDWQQNESS